MIKRALRFFALKKNKGMRCNRNFQFAHFMQPYMILQNHTPAANFYDIIMKRLIRGETNGY